MLPLILVSLAVLHHGIRLAEFAVIDLQTPSDEMSKMHAPPTLLQGSEFSGFVTLSACLHLSALNTIVVRINIFKLVSPSIRY